MPLTVNPILSVVAAQGPARDLVLQPGTVVDAKVMQLLADNLVRIAIANMSIDVVSEVPLQAGQALRRAVSQNEGGSRLAVVGQGAGAAADTVTLTPGALVDAPANPATIGVSAKNVLTPLERLAVSTQRRPPPRSRASGAATRGCQFRRVVECAAGEPASCGDAIAGAHKPRSRPDRQRDQECLQKSGLFLEASLASDGWPEPCGVSISRQKYRPSPTLLSSLAQRGACSGTGHGCWRRPGLFRPCVDIEVRKFCCRRRGWRSRWIHWH
jgi:hypothetical protein